MGDMCMSSALHADGTPWAGATNRDGEATDRMRYRKCITEYSDLATSLEILVWFSLVKKAGVGVRTFIAS